ncbi:methyltransferase domain-containing protein [Planctobacterium marinum]|uniref:Malonyl-[acyl-carrier protein] O-methyltransferase n=1 Tax=Planctobacterium marinum TaxID=1631968 RepID=A0AA48HQ98_9ALTE|nr:malonyl-[acyl-carrier protein] O-methyltransferase [Planctobacterium marinum]
MNASAMPQSVVKTPQALSESDIKQRIACRFGEAAAMYDDHALVQKEIADHALSLIANSRNGQAKFAYAIDIGCGTGAFTGRLLEFAHRATGLDLAQGMIHFAQKHYAQKQLSWTVSDAEALPLAEQSIDLIYSSMALQWLSQAEKVAKECFRIISNTGQGTLAVVVDGSLNELNYCWQSLAQSSPVNRFMPVKSWFNAFKNAGFEVQVQQKRFTSWHQNIFAVLHSIKDIGAGVVLDAGQQTPLNKTKLKTLNSVYKDKFGQENKLPLSWQIAFINFHKPQPENID